MSRSDPRDISWAVERSSNTLTRLGLTYLVGSVPVMNLAARWIARTDLRDVGNGSVSGSALYRVAGFGPLAVAGCAELAKGALGPLAVGRRRPVLGAVAAAVAIAGHNWSPWLSGRGGRGVSLVLGAGLALAPEATGVLGLGLGIGRICRRTGAGTFVALVLLPFVLRATRGREGFTMGCVLVTPVLLKRVLGNDTRLPPDWTTFRHRLLADADGPPGDGAGSR